MLEFLNKFAKQLDCITQNFCLLLLVTFFVLMFVGVVLRQAFAMGSVMLQDLSGYCFAVLILLSVVVAFAANRHVRVDVLTDSWSPKASRVLRLVAYWMFLVPVCVLVIYHVFPDIVFSWSIREGSDEPEGLGGYFLVKSVLPLVCILLLFQGFIQLYRRNSDHEEYSG